MISKTNKILSIVLLVILISGVYGTMKYDYYTTNIAYNLAKKWLAIPILFIILYWSYLNTFKYDNTVKVWKNSGQLLLMTIMFGTMLFLTSIGNIVLLNSYIGTQKKVLISEKVIRLHNPERKKIFNHYAVIIYSETAKDSLEIVVPTKSYKVGDDFNKEMYCGKLGIYYSN